MKVSAADTVGMLDLAGTKAFRRLLPLALLCYVLSFVDSTNVAIAKLTMKEDLPWFSDAVYGDGCAAFFLGYLALAHPGARLVERLSARKLIAASMVVGGVLTSAMAFIRAPMHFYALRTVLGITQGVFASSMCVYLLHWLPKRESARATPWVLIAMPLSQILSAKMSNAMLDIHLFGLSDLPHRLGLEQWIHVLGVKGWIQIFSQKIYAYLIGLRGWQWMFIGWGLPTIILGLLMPRGLPDRPYVTWWLSIAERAALELEYERNQAEVGAKRNGAARRALGHRKLVLLGLVYFAAVAASYGIVFFLPSILRDSYELSRDTVTWLLMLPPSGAIVTLLLARSHSDPERDRRPRMALALFFGAAVLFAVPRTEDSLVLTMACFVGAAASVALVQPSLWALRPLLVSEATSGGIALIYGMGSLGGAFGLSMMGHMKIATGSYSRGLTLLATVMSLAAVVVFLLGLGKERQSRPNPTRHAPPSAV